MQSEDWPKLGVVSRTGVYSGWKEGRESLIGFRLKTPTTKEMNSTTQIIVIESTETNVFILILNTIIKDKEHRRTPQHTQLKQTQNTCKKHLGATLTLTKAP